MYNIIIHDNYFENANVKALNSDYNGSYHSVWFIELFRQFGYSNADMFDIWNTMKGTWEDTVVFLMYLQKYNLVSLIDDMVVINEIEELEIIPPVEA